MLKKKLLAVGLLAAASFSVPAPLSGICSFEHPRTGWVYMYYNCRYEYPCAPPGRKCLIEYYADGSGSSEAVPRGCRC